MVADETWVHSFAAYRASLRRYFHRRVAGGEVDDLVQDVFTRIHARTAGDEIINFDRYVIRVAANVLTSWYTQKRRESAVFAPVDAASAFDEPRTAITPERSLASREEAKCVISALGCLPKRTRMILMLHRFEHLTYPQIAQRLGISVSAVEKHVSRGLHQLSSARRALDRL